MARGQRVGYIRVSSLGQNPDRQLEGVEVDRVFTDTVSGKSVERPALSALLAFVATAMSSWCTRWTAWRATWMMCAGWCGS